MGTLHKQVMNKIFLRKEQPSCTLPPREAKVRAKPPEIISFQPRKQPNHPPKCHKKLYYEDYLDTNKMWFTKDKPAGFGAFDLTNFGIGAENRTPTLKDVASLANDDFEPEQQDYKKALKIYKEIMGVQDPKKFEKMVECYQNKSAKSSNNQE